jgi:hypothetical protein
MPTPPSAPREYRGSSGPRLHKGKRFNSAIISDCGSSRRVTCLDRVGDRQHLQGEHV